MIELKSSIFVISNKCVCVVCVCVCVQLCPMLVTLQTVAHQALMSMGFSRQEYWSEQPFPSPGHLPDSEIKPVTLESPALAGRFFTNSTTLEDLNFKNKKYYMKTKKTRNLCIEELNTPLSVQAISSGKKRQAKI